MHRDLLHKSGRRIAIKYFIIGIIIAMQNYTKKEPTASHLFLFTHIHHSPFLKGLAISNPDNRESSEAESAQIVSTYIKKTVFIPIII